MRTVGFSEGNWLQAPHTTNTTSKKHTAQPYLRLHWSCRCKGPFGRHPTSVVCRCCSMPLPVPGCQIGNHLLSRFRGKWGKEFNKNWKPPPNDFPKWNIKKTNLYIEGIIITNKFPIDKFDSLILMSIVIKFTQITPKSIWRIEIWMDKAYREIPWSGAILKFSRFPLVKPPCHHMK